MPSQTQADCVPSDMHEACDLTAIQPIFMECDYPRLIVDGPAQDACLSHAADHSKWREPTVDVARVDSEDPPNLNSGQAA